MISKIKILTLLLNLALILNVVLFINLNNEKNFLNSKESIPRVKQTQCLNIGRPSPRKVIFNQNSWIKGYGYCNLVYGMLSAMTYAILSDRQLHILWPDIEAYILEPFPDTFTSNRTLIKTSTYLNPDLKNSWKKDKNISEIIKRVVSDKSEVQIVRYQDYPAYWFELCSNPIYYDKLLALDLVDIDTVENARGILAVMNEAANDLVIDNVYKIGFEVGHRLLIRHWVVNDEIMQSINSFIEKEFEGNYVIGLQIRSTYARGSNYTKAFIDCALQMEELYFDRLVVKKPVRWFLSSDSSDILDMMQAAISSVSQQPNKAIVAPGEKPGHIGREKKSYVRALFDLDALSRTDVMVVTGGSTYGIVAQLKKGKLQYGISFAGGEAQGCKKITLSDTGRTPDGDYGI